MYYHRGSSYYKQATEWFQKAANQGHLRAQHNTGMLYTLDWENGRSYEKALGWFSIAAQQGDPLSCLKLGRMYFHGSGGLTKDYKKAVEWFQKSANQGNAEGQFHIGVMYYNGDGVSEDYKEAIKWFQKSASQGYSIAKQVLERLKIKEIK